MDRTACTEPQCLYKGTLYLYLLWSHTIKEHHISVTMIYVQNDLRHSVCSILCILQRICCPSENFIFAPYVVSGLQYSLQDFFSCLQFLQEGYILYVPPQSAVNGCEIRWPWGLGLWTNISTKHERVVLCVIFWVFPPFRRWGNTQKITHNTQNTAKVWDQE